MHYNRHWTFLTLAEFKKFQKSFELKNEKREQDRRMWLWGWQKLPVKILHWKEVNWFISIPSGLRGFLSFQDLYGDLAKVIHPEINNPFKGNELDLKQNKVITELLNKDVWYGHISTGVWKTMITAKIIKQKSVKTLIVVSGIELMTQMRNDLEEVFWEKYPTIDGKSGIVKQILIENKELEKIILQWEVLLREKELWYLSDEQKEIVWDSKTIAYKEKFFNQWQLKALKKLKNKIKGFKDQREFYEEINYKKLNKVMDSNIVIANIDTLVTLPVEEFFSKFDLTIMDEVDSYLSADRRREMVWQKINSKYIYGVTGTIQLNYTSDKVFDMYLGPKAELLEKHFSPDIYKVMSELRYHLDDLTKFHELKKAVYWDEDRNNLIVDTVLKTIWNKKWILFSEYIEHAKILKEKLENKWIKCFMLIGEVKEKERLEIKKQLKEHKWTCVLIGSVKIVWRWFNIPELSVGYLTTVEKFKSNIEQYVWRIIRIFPWKTSCTWYDFIDPWCKTLLNQSKSRGTTYKKEFPNSNIEFYTW